MNKIKILYLTTDSRIGGAEKNIITLLIFIFLLAFVVRLGVIFSMDYGSIGFGDSPGDYEDYVRGLVSGKGYVNSFGYHAFRPVLFPLFWALLQLLFGPAYLPVRIGLALLGAGICIVTYFLGREMFSSRIGAVAACGAAFYPPLVWYSTRLMTESLFIFFSLLFIYYLLKQYHKLSLWGALGGGLFWGLATLSRSVILGFLPLAFLWLFIAHWKNKWKTGKIGLFFLLGLLLVMTPWIVRNWLVLQAFIPTTTDGGEVFYIGNNERTLDDPRGFSFPDSEQIDSLRKLGEVEYNRIMYQKGLTFIRNNPQEFLLLMGNKFCRFWRLWPHVQYVGRSNALIYFLTNILVFPLTVLGLVLGWKYRREGQRKFLLVYFLVIYYTMVHMVYIATMRYREPLAPFFLIFASYAVCSLWQRKRLNEYHSF